MQSWRVLKRFPCTHSFRKLLNQLSVGASSQQMTLRLIEQVIPYTISLAWKSWLANWLLR
jgi:hypothetical protein